MGWEWKENQSRCYRCPLDIINRLKLEKKSVRLLHQLAFQPTFLQLFLRGLSLVEIHEQILSMQIPEMQQFWRYLSENEVRGHTSPFGFCYAKYNMDWSWMFWLVMIFVRSDTTWIEAGFLLWLILFFLVTHNMEWRWFCCGLILDSSKSNTTWIEADFVFEGFWFCLYRLII